MSTSGPCVLCAVETAHIVEIVANGGAAVAAGVSDGETIREQHMCPKCLQETTAGLARWHALFERLLSMGASRAAANAIVIKHMDRGKR